MAGCSIGAVWSRSDIRSDSNVYGAAWDSASDPSGKNFSTIRDDLNASSPQAEKYLRLITIRERWFKSLDAITSPGGHVDSPPPLTTLQQIFSDVGLSSTLVDMRTQAYNQYNPMNDTCSYRKPNLKLTDAERLSDITCGNGGKIDLIELILASAILNGLSRYGSRHIFEPESLNPMSRSSTGGWNDTPKATNFAKSLISNKPRNNAILPPPPGSGFVTLHLTFRVYGYAWYASSTSDYLATGVIATYLFIAVMHTLWILIRRKTSSSWDTVTELLALALQSPVATSLLGSGAAIERLNTYKRLVRLRVVKDGEGERQGVNERLVIVLKEESSVDTGENPDAPEHLSGGLKHMTATSAALAIPSVDSAMAQNEPRVDHKESRATYGRVEADKKYL